MQFFRAIKKYVVILLLPLVLGLFANSIINQHSHKLISGEEITHAHPFSSQDGTSHQHTKAEYLLLQLISSPISIAALFFALAGVFLLLTTELKRTFTVQRPVLQHCRVRNDRAPPFFK